MDSSATLNIDNKVSFLEGKVRLLVGILQSWGQRVEDLLEKNPVKAVVGFSVLYFAWATMISGLKQLWFDELVSYSVDHVPTWRDAWHMLELGVDANPPLFHFVNRVLLSIFGDSVLVQRGSSILGFWGMSLCVHWIVRRHHTAAAAWVAALVPACSGAAYYATESRPYGLVLCFVSLAIICWLQLDIVGPYRRWWLVGLNLALACAVSSHYFAVFAVAPFVGAEITRALRRSRIDWPMLGALFGCCWPLGIFYSTGLMGAAGQYSGNTGSTSWLTGYSFWMEIGGPLVGSVVAITGLAAALAWLNGRSSKIEFGTSDVQLVGAWFCVMPIVVTFAARYVTHSYEHRYAITAILGLAILCGIVLNCTRLVVPGVAGWAVLILLFPVLAEAIAGRANPKGRHTEYSWALAAQADPSLPVVYGMPLEFVQAWFNAPNPDLKTRITCLYDVKEGWARTGSITADLGVLNLMPALPMPVHRYADFIAQRKPFYLINRPAIVSWVTAKLVEDGAELRLKGIFGADELYLVTWDPAGTKPSPLLKP